MKVIVHHSHLTTTLNYGKSCGLSTSKKEKSCDLRRAIMLWWEPHMSFV